MPRFQLITKIDASPERVWAAMVDVEHWADWSETVQSIKRESDGPFRLGSAAFADIKGGGPPSTWTVTQFDDRRSFTWESATRGVKSIAYHAVEADGAGTRATLAIRTHGFMGLLFYPMIAALYRRNVSIEAKGLKRYCEQSASA